MHELNAKIPVILYGASTRGTFVYEQLKNKCNIVGFIDKRADELRDFHGLPVKNLEDIYFAQYKMEAVVIVCVSNIFEHERITLSLLHYGYSYVLFCPVDGSDFVYRSDEEREVLVLLHEQLLANNLPVPTNLPNTKGLYALELRDSALISEEADSVIARIALPFAYTRLIGNGVFQDSPVMTLFPYLHVYEYFSGKIGASPDNYINLYCRPAAESTRVKPTQRWRENVLSSRGQVYERMKQAEQLNPLFFEEHAVEAKWNAGGAYFNMMSGKHRAAYLLHSGKWYVPLNVSKPDYAEYVNIKCVEILRDYIAENGIYDLPYPIFNPYFMKMPYMVGGNFFELLSTLCMAIVSFIYEMQHVVQIRRLTLHNTVAELEPVAQLLAKLGMDVFCDYEPALLDELVRNLYRVHLDTSNRKTGYDIALHVFYKEGGPEYDAKLHGLLIRKNEISIAENFFVLQPICVFRDRFFAIARAK